MNAAPASASATVTVAVASVAYVDSAAPRTSLVDPTDLPVGAFTTASGATHVSKSYATFDLSTLVGQHLLSVGLVADETAVADCTVPSATQVFLTDTARKPTWNSQPAESTELTGPGDQSACPAQGLSWDATTVLRDALAAGRKTVTFVLRLPDAHQSDPTYARRYGAGVRLVVNGNHPPAKPTVPQVNGTACAAKPIPVSARGISLSAILADADDSSLVARFDYWPVDHPEQRVELTRLDTFPGFRVDIPVDPSTLADGTVYAWQMRGDDGVDLGQFSTTCEFTTDFTAPAVAPTVSSTDYPSTAGPNQRGGTGIPGQFTFKANGVADVTGFYYATGFSFPNTFVAANHKGGSATIEVTPDMSGTNVINVLSVDAAGNQSPIVTMNFEVADNEPTVTCTPASAFVGQPRQCTFAPGGTQAAGALGVVSYDYQQAFRPATTVPAGPDGTATVTITPPAGQDDFPIEVAARLTNGNLTEQNFTSIPVDQGAPQIHPSRQEVVAGTQLSYTMVAVLPGSVSFTYSTPAQPPTTVPVGPDGTATVTLTPTAPGEPFFQAFSTTADGTQSGSTTVFVVVDTNGPTVQSADYPRGQVSGALGQPGTFTFASPVPNAVNFTYALNGGTPLTVPAAEDGTASVVVTPNSLFDTLVVTTTFADGSTSLSTNYVFEANSVAPTISCTPPSPAPGQVFECTFQPVQHNVVSYSYSWNGEPQVAVAAGPDGTATVSLTAPGFETVTELVVTSTDSAGITSDPGIRTVFVEPSSTVTGARAT